jgi:hypothetical protein
VPVRTCTVSFTDADSIRHSVDVQAETLYEAAALAVQAFREHNLILGPACKIDIEARLPGVTHTVTMGKVRDWVESAAKSPRDRVMKERLKGLLAF